MSLADNNRELDRGLGAGAAWVWPYFEDETRNVVVERMNTHCEFAKGMGFGLARIIRHFSDGSKEWVNAKVSEDPCLLKDSGKE